MVVSREIEGAGCSSNWLVRDVIWDLVYVHNFQNISGTYCRLRPETDSSVMLLEIVMSTNDRFVVNHPDGWAVKRAGADRASGVFDRQADAQKVAKTIVSNLGGGEVRTQDRHGKWRDSDTVPPGHDPFPPRDKR